MSTWALPSPFLEHFPKKIEVGGGVEHTRIQKIKGEAKAWRMQEIPKLRENVNCDTNKYPKELTDLQTNLIEVSEENSNHFAKLEKVTGMADYFKAWNQEKKTRYNQWLSCYCSGYKSAFNNFKEFIGKDLKSHHQVGLKEGQKLI